MRSHSFQTALSYPFPPENEIWCYRCLVEFQCSRSSYAALNPLGARRCCRMRFAGPAPGGQRESMMAGRAALPPATRSGGGWLIPQHRLCVGAAACFHLKYGYKLIFLKFAFFLPLKHQLNHCSGFSETFPKLLEALKLPNETVDSCLKLQKTFSGSPVYEKLSKHV